MHSAFTRLLIFAPAIAVSISSGFSQESTHQVAVQSSLKTDGETTDKGNRSFFGRLDFNRSQNPDAKRMLNLRAALSLIVCEGLSHLFADLPNAVALVAPRAVHPLPCRIAAPKLVTDKVNLRGTYIFV